VIDQEGSWIHTSNPQEVLCEVLTQEVDLVFFRRIDQEEKEFIISNSLNFFLFGDQAQNKDVPNQISRAAIPHKFSSLGGNQIKSIAKESQQIILSVDREFLQTIKTPFEGTVNLSGDI